MRLHPDALVLLVALGGVLLLTLLAEGLDPPRVALADAPAHEGARVAVEARVLDVRHGERGRFLTLSDARHRLGALMGPGEGPAPGDLVRATGVVQRLDGGWGLSLERLDVLEPAASRPLAPAQLAREPLAHVGARVLVLGELRDDALVGGGARVRVAGDEPPAREGRWLAAGTWTYRAGDAAYALRVDAWTPAP